jgi:hypothetical protein
MQSTSHQRSLQGCTGSPIIYECVLRANRVRIRTRDTTKHRNPSTYKHKLYIQADILPGRIKTNAQVQIAHLSSQAGHTRTRRIRIRTYTYETTRPLYNICYNRYHYQKAEGLVRVPTPPHTHPIASVYPHEPDTDTETDSSRKLTS